MLVDDRRQVIRRAEQRQAGQIVVPHLRLGVDEADEIQTVFGMAQQLAGDALPDVAGAEDERVLLVERTPAAERACDRARESDEHDRRAPQHDGVRHGRVGKPGQFERGEHEPCPDRDEVEDADDVVSRRVVRALLVLVVQVIETRDRDPHGSETTDAMMMLRSSPAPVRPTTRNARASPTTSAMTSMRRTSQPRRRARRAGQERSRRAEHLRRTARPSLPTPTRGSPRSTQTTSSTPITPKHGASDKGDLGQTQILSPMACAIPSGSVGPGERRGYAEPVANSTRPKSDAERVLKIPAPLGRAHAPLGVGVNGRSRGERAPRGSRPPARARTSSSRLGYAPSSRAIRGSC